mmetsp:Transcript_1100/g.2430  ORF Transcript_1100/g.2430 Transcript_1100/m.2430 type:complete len:143 (-) Transcript_1100:1661-2089(-)|eukprot:CAMPEP_0113471384 /NCGR_PEP_ID=MMETSP0014_2-20120614/16947_1 /TAXON_ID=2857 /ORGANISM="Nitzschia sp." /LENGTH=142 /DNA_ID=CAMNT_0000364011 /DNA_START=314 /DNA_END=742 /DNA_ORIENTATION=- /assembly_acc=CAM_ASM_000159
MIRTLVIAVVAAAAILSTESDAFSVVSKSTAAARPFGTALYSSTLPSTNSNSNKMSQDDKDKAFLTEQFSSNSPPAIFPPFVVEGHHPADFESDGGIMMTEHKDPKEKQIFESKAVPAVSESTAKKIGPVVDHHLPPFYYFE